MRKVYFPKNIITRVISIILILGLFSPLIYMFLTEEEFNLPMKIIDISILLIISFSIHMFFIRLDKKGIMSVSPIKIFRLSYEEIRMIGMGFYQRKMNIPALVIYIKDKKNPVFLKEKYIFHLNYKRESLIEIIKTLKEKNNSITLTEEIQGMLNDKNTEFDHKVKRKLKKQDIIILVSFLAYTLYMVFYVILDNLS